MVENLASAMPPPSRTRQLLQPHSAEDNSNNYNNNNSDIESCSCSHSTIGTSRSTLASSRHSCTHNRPQSCSHSKQIILNCKTSLVTCTAIPISLFISTVIFLLGIFTGPLWLVCIGVAIAVVTMVCSLFLYMMSKKSHEESEESRDNTSISSFYRQELNANNGGVYWYFNHLLKPVKLPRYDEIPIPEPNVRVIVVKPPDYSEIDHA